MTKNVNNAVIATVSVVVVMFIIYEVVKQNTAAAAVPAGNLQTSLPNQGNASQYPPPSPPLPNDWKNNQPSQQNTLSSTDDGDNSNSDTFNTIFLSQ